MAFSKVLIPIVLLAALYHFAEALECHQCTSFTDSQCDDPFYYEPTREGEKPKPKTNEFLKACPNDGHNYTLCRKIYQNVRDDVRIIRSCGYEKYKSDCYKTVLEEYNTLVCQCFEDGCNSAPHSAAASVFALLGAAVIAWAFH